MRALLVPALVFSSVLVNAQDGPKLAGKAMPAFKFTDLKGKAITNASVKGKVTLIDFWATWCGPCRMAAPTVNQLAKKYGAKVNVLGVSTDDTTAQVAAYQKKHGYVYRFATGGEATSQKLGVPGIPFFVVLNKKGTIVGTVLGAEDTLGAQLDGLIKKAMKG